MPEAKEDLRYPIGRFEFNEQTTPAQHETWISAIAEAPARLKSAVDGLTDEQLDHPYRDGGWTVRQVAHHLLDSHMNSYVRVRRALTEDTPEVAGYDENLWAQLPDALKSPISDSLLALEGVHARWVTLLHAMSAEQYARKMRHSAMGLVSLEKTLALYAWHGAHHVAHITALRSRKGWG